MEEIGVGECAAQEPPFQPPDLVTIQVAERVADDLGTRVRHRRQPMPGQHLEPPPRAPHTHPTHPTPQIASRAYSYITSSPDPALTTSRNHQISKSPNRKMLLGFHLV